MEWVALYDSAGDTATGTPAFGRGERLKLLKRHDSGWLEMETGSGVIGYVSPSWVQEESAQEVPGSAAGSAPMSPTIRGSIAEEDMIADAAAIAAAAVAAAATNTAEDEKEESVVLQQSASKAPPPPVSKRTSKPQFAPRSPSLSRVSTDFLGGLNAKLSSGPAAVLPKKKPPPTKPRLSRNESVDQPTPTDAEVAAFPVLSGEPQEGPAAAAAVDAVGDCAVEPEGAPAIPGELPLATNVAKPLPLSPAPAPAPAQQSPPPTPSPSVQSPPQMPSPSLQSPPAVTPQLPVASTTVTPESLEVPFTSGLKRANSYKPHEGLLERKVTLEGGRESKGKKWDKIYAALAGPTMYFFKDEKSKRAGKKPLGFLKVRGKKFDSNVDVGDKKRKFCFSLGDSVEHSIFSAPSQESKAEWSSRFEEHNGNVNTDSAQSEVGLSASSAPAVEVAASPEVPMPESPSAAAPVTRVSPLPKSDGTNATGTTDLSPSVQAKCANITGSLNRYLLSPHTLEDVRERGIETTAVFGGHIIEQVVRELKIKEDAVTPGVPTVVVKCIEYVDKHLKEQGIYRVSGNSSNVQKLVQKCDADVFSVNLKSTKDVHVVTGLLKLYFRELAEPLFTNALYDDFIAAASMADKNARMGRIKQLVHALPGAHQVTLEYTCRHLLRVSAEAAHNKMNVNNVAIVFGPTLLRKSDPSMENIIRDSTFQSAVVEQILTEVDWFMAHDQ